MQSASHAPAKVDRYVVGTVLVTNLIIGALAWWLVGLLASDRYLRTLGVIVSVGIPNMSWSCSRCSRAWSKVADRDRTEVRRVALEAARDGYGASARLVGD